MRAKRYISIILLIFLLAGTTATVGCGSDTRSTAAGKETIIATSFYPVYIMTKNVAGDVPGVRVVNITNPGVGCLHDYQLSPDDLKKLQKASILVVNGAGMESFLDKVVQQRPGLKIVDASQGIDFITNDKGEKNPHVWVSVSLAMRQVQNIAGQLGKLDPKHADLYKKNAADYNGKLVDLRDQMHEGLENVKSRDIITFHEAFPYFARELDLRVVTVIEREPGSEPNARELAETIKVVKRQKVKAIFAEQQYPARAAQAIARETGIKVYYLDPGVTGSYDSDAYIKAMENNLKTLREALN